jgi:hypothetical protein
MRKLAYLAAVATLLAASAPTAFAGEDGFRRHRHQHHYRHHHRHGVDVIYGTPGYALPPYCCEPSVVATPGLPTVVYGPPIFPDPLELESVYLVDQVATGTYPLGQYRDPALFRSPYEYPYVSAYAPYYPRYRHRTHRRLYYK